MSGGHGGGILGLDHDWGELFILLLLTFGFVIGMAIRQPLFAYLFAIIAGGVAGRGFYLRRMKEPILTSLLFTISFIIGYVVGAFWANRFIILILFLVAWYISYKLHKRHYFKTFKSNIFVR